MHAATSGCCTSVAGIIVTCLGVSLAVAVVYNYTLRPVYQATAQILIDRDTPNVLPNKELVDLVQGGSDYYQTQYQLLAGRTLAERVVERLQMQKSRRARDRADDEPGRARAAAVRPRPPSAFVDPNGMPLSPAVAAFRSRVQVEPVPGSRLVNLRFSAYDPRMSPREAVNALAAALHRAVARAALHDLDRGDAAGSPSGSGSSRRRSRPPRRRSRTTASARGS